MKRPKDERYVRLIDQIVRDLDFAMAATDTTRHAAAKRAGLSPGTVYAIMRRRGRTWGPKLSTLFALGKGLGIEIDIKNSSPKYRIAGK